MFTKHLFTKRLAQEMFTAALHIKAKNWELDNKQNGHMNRGVLRSQWNTTESWKRTITGTRNNIDTESAIFFFFFYKEPESKSFGLFGPRGLCRVYSILQLEGLKQAAKWMWLSSNKALLMHVAYFIRFSHVTKYPSFDFFPNHFFENVKSILSSQTI